MSDSQAYEEVRISSDGVTVTKRFEEDEFPVPAIAFEFATERDETVTVTLSDKVPESVAVEDLGFHPEYGSEYWTIDEDEISFEREFDANSEYTTVYGIRATGADDVEKFLTEPVLEEVEPPLPADESEEESETEPAEGAEDIVPESDDNIVKDVISGEGSVPGLEDEDDSTDEEIETLDLKDPNAPSDGSTTVTTTTDSGDAESDDGDGEEAPEPEAVELNGESVVSAMANEIRQNEVSVDDLKLLQRAIDKVSDRSGATGNGAHDARVEKLQSDIADLRAYTDALEEFLEENGTGDQLIRDFESQLEAFDQTLDQVQSELSETTDTVSEVRTEMDDVSGDVDAIGDEVETVSEEMDDVESSIEELESSLETMEANVDELEEEVTDGDVAGRLDEIEDELTDLREWQDQIKSTFGG